MSLDQVVSLAITRLTVFPSRAGFGVPMVVGYHTATPNIVDFYEGMTQVAGDHAITSPIYKAMQVAFSQNPCPAIVALGKRLSPPTPVVTLTPKLTTQGLHYIFDFVDHLGVVTHVDYLVPGGATPTSIAAGISALLGTPAGTTAVAVSGVLTITSTTAGYYFDLQNLPPLLQLAVKDTTPDPGLAADLVNIASVDTTAWYDFVLDRGGKAEILAAAAWTEATRHLFYCQSSDSEIADNAVTTDVMSSLVAGAYARTGLMFSQTSLANHRDLAIEARMSTITPGASTWEYQTLAGITVDKIDPGSQIKIMAKGAAIYTVLGGENKTQNVLVADHEFVDLIPGTDKTYADIQFNCVTLLFQASEAGSKVPFTDGGITLVKGVIGNALQGMTDSGFLAPNPAYQVFAPLAKNIAPADRASRTLKNVTFTANLAGAIHKLAITGTLSA